MKASRESTLRSVDLSAVSDPQMIHRAILNLLTRRVHPMRLTELSRWFRATPISAIQRSLNTLMDRELIEVRRTSLNRKRTGYVYQPISRGEGKVASREEQHGTYLDVGPGAWDDRDD